MENKLLRNQHDQMIAGVASGLAEYLKIDVIWIRLVFLLAVFAGLSGLIIYIILWIVIPPKSYVHPFDVDYKVYDDKNDPDRVSPPLPVHTKKEGNGRLVAGILLICMGAYFLSEEFDFLPYWISFNKLWPIALIIPGIMILIKAGKKDHVEHHPKESDKKPDVIEDDKKDTGEKL
jgi:phage shock protein C